MTCSTHSVLKCAVCDQPGLSFFHCRQIPAPRLATNQPRSGVRCIYYTHIPYKNPFPTTIPPFCWENHLKNNSNYFGPWTADVQGPPLNYGKMNGKLTIVQTAHRPATRTSPPPCPDALPGSGMSSSTPIPRNLMKLMPFYAFPSPPSRFPHQKFLTHCLSSS
jgi:hypothetical protein